MRGYRVCPVHGVGYPCRSKALKKRDPITINYRHGKYSKMQFRTLEDLQSEIAAIEAEGRAKIQRIFEETLHELEKELKGL